MASSALALQSTCARSQASASSGFFLPTQAITLLSAKDSLTVTVKPLFHLQLSFPAQSLSSRDSTCTIRASAEASGEGKPQRPSDSPFALPPPSQNSQGGMHPSGQPGASSSQPVSTDPVADPLWKDVFPEYLRNRESDARGAPAMGTPASAQPLLPERGGSMEGLGPGFRSQSMTSYSMAVPADASMPRYMREPVVRNDPIWAAIRAEARLEVGGR